MTTIRRTAIDFVFEWRERGYVAYDFYTDGFSADVVEIDLNGCSHLTSLPSLDGLAALQTLELNDSSTYRSTIYE